MKISSVVLGLLAGASVLLQGCAVSPGLSSTNQLTMLSQELIEGYQEPVEHGAVIEVFRDNFDVGKLCYDTIMINDKRVARLASSSKVRFNVKPGTYKITVGLDWEGKGTCGCTKEKFQEKATSIDLTVEEGKVYAISYMKELPLTAPTLYVGGVLGMSSVEQHLTYKIFADSKGLSIEEYEKNGSRNLIFVGKFKKEYLDLLEPGENKATVHIINESQACTRVLMLDGKQINPLFPTVAGTIYIPEGKHSLSVSFSPDPEFASKICPASMARFKKYKLTKDAEFKAGHTYTLTFSESNFTGRHLDLKEEYK